MLWPIREVVVDQAVQVGRAGEHVMGTMRRTGEHVIGTVWWWGVAVTQGGWGAVWPIREDVVNQVIQIGRAGEHVMGTVWRTGEHVIGTVWWWGVAVIQGGWGTVWQWITDWGACGGRCLVVGRCGDPGRLGGIVLDWGSEGTALPENSLMAEHCGKPGDWGTPRWVEGAGDSPVGEHLNWPF